MAASATDSKSAGRQVRVLEAGVVGSLDYKIIEAGRADDLYAWLKDNNYNYSGDEATLDYLRAEEVAVHGHEDRHGPDQQYVMKPRHDIKAKKKKKKYGSELLKLVKYKKLKKRRGRMYDLYVAYKAGGKYFEDSIVNMDAAIQAAANVDYILLCLGEYEY